MPQTADVVLLGDSSGGDFGLKHYSLRRSYAPIVGLPAGHRILGFAINDIDGEGSVTGNFGFEWKSIRINGRPAKGRELETGRGRQALGHIFPDAKFPPKAIIQTKLVDGKPAWRARP